MEEVNKFGDGISWEEHMHHIIKDEDIILHGEDKKSDLVSRILKYAKGTNLIDCGCHMGRWHKFFIGAGFVYTGVDQSKEIIEYCKENYPYLAHKFVLSMLWDMEFKEEFDIAISIAVLQHNKLDEKKRILPKIYNALKPGGVFFMTESTIEASNVTQLSRNDWLALVEGVGFTFKESWHTNELGIEDHYIFVKE